MSTYISSASNGGLKYLRSLTRSDNEVDQVDLSLPWISLKGIVSSNIRSTLNSGLKPTSI